MANDSSSEGPLNIEITENVARVDAVMANIIKDRSVWKEFFRNPAKVLGDMGLMRPPSEANAWRYKKMFYALLTDRDLLQFITEHDFRPHMDAPQVDRFYDGLKAGTVDFDPAIDVDIVGRVKNDPAVFGAFLKIALTRLNTEGIFEGSYDEADIDRCVTTVVGNAKANNSLSEMIKSLPWHGETDEEFHVMAVIPPAIAVPVVAEAVACGTLACVVVPMAEGGLAKQSLETLQAEAFIQGDRDSIRALSLLGLVLEFISEMADHTNEFERVLRA